MKYTKLAIHGGPNTGKSTLANLLCETLQNKFNPFNCVILSFADPIKKIAQNFINRDRCESEYGELNKHETTIHNGLYGDSKYRETIIPDFGQEPLTFRNLIDKIGELGREFDPDIWVKKVSKEIKLLEYSDFEFNFKHLYIIPDLRRPNELKYVKDNNFCLVRIKRNQKVEREFQPHLNALDHLPDSDFHFVIENNDSIDKLKKHTKKLVDFLVKT